MLRVLATRVLTHLGRAANVPLGGVRAHLEPQVLCALGLPDAPRKHRLVEGRRLEDALVRQEQARWSAGRPALVAAGLVRHAETMGRLGLGT